MVQKVVALVVTWGLGTLQNVHDHTTAVDRIRQRDGVFRHAPGQVTTTQPEQPTRALLMGSTARSRMLSAPKDF